MAAGLSSGHSTISCSDHLAPVLQIQQVCRPFHHQLLLLLPPPPPSRPILPSKQASHRSIPPGPNTDRHLTLAKCHAWTTLTLPIIHTHIHRQLLHLMKCLLPLALHVCHSGSLPATFFPTLLNGARITSYVCLRAHVLVSVTLFVNRKSYFRNRCRMWGSICTHVQGNATAEPDGRTHTHTHTRFFTVSPCILIH